MNGSVRNELYTTTHTPGASLPKQVIWYSVHALFFRNPLFPFSSIKIAVLKWFGAEIEEGVVIKPSVNIKYPWKLKIGRYTWIGEGVWIDNLSDITIGSNVTLSQGALLLTGSHDYKKETFDFISRPIILEDGCWICARAIVTGGVVCKTHSVLSAGSVASKDLQAYTIYKGNPASVAGVRTIA